MKGAGKVVAGAFKRGFLTDDHAAPRTLKPCASYFRSTSEEPLSTSLL